MKKRKQKEIEYLENYQNIPKDYYQRLQYLYITLNINSKLEQEILDARNKMLQDLYCTDLFIILYEEPEGSPRPRFRLVNRKNLANQAMSNSQFVHVYSITGAEDNKFMRRLVTESDFIDINNLIYTPCYIEYTAFIKTPKSFNRKDTFLAEIGCIRPICKPDWDNIGKKYSDMYNGNIWLDDTLVIEGVVKKYYSILPRVEIKLKYLNMLYNKYQYNSISNKIETEVEYFK